MSKLPDVSEKKLAGLPLAGKSEDLDDAEANDGSKTGEEGKGWKGQTEDDPDDKFEGRTSSGWPFGDGFALPGG